MRRRELIKVIGGAAIAWPLTAHAQQPDKMRLVGILTGIGTGSETKARLSAFLPELQQLGWIEGQNLRIELRVGEGDVAATRKAAKELVALAPDAILCIGNSSMPPLTEATQTIPVVFTIVIDPVGAGFVQSLSRPNRNVTGFMMFEYSLGHHDLTEPRLESALDENQTFGAIVYSCVSKMQHGDRNANRRGLIDVAARAIIAMVRGGTRGRKPTIMGFGLHSSNSEPRMWVSGHCIRSTSCPLYPQ